MAGHSYYNGGTAAASPGTAVDILGDAGFTAKQVMIINDAAALILTVTGLGMTNSVSVGPKEVLVLAGSYKSLRVVEATGVATYRVIASDSTLPALSISNIT
jgi:hypothetical protein